MDQRVRQAEVEKVVEEVLFREQIEPRVRQEIIDEHRTNPIGKHSADLEKVLIYLRSHHQMMAGKYILVCTKPHEEWRVATVSGQPNVPPELTDEKYFDRYEAEHGVFLRRLKDANLWTVEADK